MSHDSSRAQTLIACIRRLSQQNISVENTDQRSLSIHILGADRREGDSFEETNSIFALFFDFAVQHFPHINRCFFYLIGPNVSRKLHLREWNMHKHTIHFRIAYFSGVFEEFPGRNSPISLAVLYNAGIWGYDSWLPTLQHLFSYPQTIVLITSYNAQEASDEEDFLQEQFPSLHWLFRPEKNPNASSVPHIASFPRIRIENQYQMCVQRHPIKYEYPQA